MDVDLDGVWWARRAGDGEDGAPLSVPGPLDAPPPGAGWLRTRVPCTALGVLIDAGEVSAASARLAVGLTHLARTASAA
jgi:hypothetical protein